MPLSPITAPEQPRAPSQAGLSLPLDPLLTLAVLGLGVCSVLTLRAVTATNPTGNPHYYVYRQVAYLASGRSYGRPLAPRLSTPAALGRAHLRGPDADDPGPPRPGHDRRNVPQRGSNSRLSPSRLSEVGKVRLIVALSAFVVDRSRQLRSARRRSG